MKKYELLELKKLYLSKIKFERKTKLNNSQKTIIILFSFFILCFISYKIGYSITLIKENTKYLLKFTQKIRENNIQNEITNNTNITIIITEEILIPVSYSNHLEDLILNCFFYDINNGFYIDLGIFGPNKTSTTKYFYLKGWNGINIKPIGEEYKELEQIRERDINYNYYLGGKNHNKFFFQSECFECLNDANISFNKIVDIFNANIPKNKEIHFLKIDLVKDTRKILLGYDFENFRPKIFCITSYNNTNNTGLINIPDYESYEYILNKNDYSFIYQYENIRYYADDKIDNLKERVKTINEIITLYKKNNKRNKNSK